MDFGLTIYNFKILFIIIKWWKESLYCKQNFILNIKSFISKPTSLKLWQYSSGFYGFLSEIGNNSSFVFKRWKNTHKIFWFLQIWSGFDVIGYIFLGSCITMAVILTATTLYYRRKLKKLSQSASQAKNTTSSTSHSQVKDNKKKKKVKRI